MTTRDYIACLEHEFARLEYAEEFLVTPAEPALEDGTPLVAVSDNQETTVFVAEALLAALRACPDGTPYEELWHAMLPCQVAA